MMRAVIFSSSLGVNNVFKWMKLCGNVLDKRCAHSAELARGLHSNTEMLPDRILS